jgi:DNA-binding LacI/PurR family transcriptional regulator
MSMQKIADIVGVSKATVSFVANGKPGVSPETANKVLEAMREYGYTPKANKAKRGAVNMNYDNTGIKTGVIGVLMANGVISTVPFYARLLDAIHQQLESRGLKIAPMRYSGKATVSKDTQSDLDGILLCAYHKELASEISIPFVSVLGHPDPKDKLCADHIEPANDRIGVMAADYFYKRGHKGVIGVNPSVLPHFAFESRLNYFVNACIDNHIKAMSVKVPFNDRDAHGRLVEADHVEAIHKFVAEYKSLSEKPTGIFVPCDSHLVLIQKCFSAAGFRPGVDIEFLGCNNDSMVLAGLETCPATIDINPGAIAKAALVTLLDKIDYSQPANVPHKIISIEPSLISAGVGIKDNW